MAQSGDCLSHRCSVPRQVHTWCGLLARAPEPVLLARLSATRWPHVFRDRGRHGKAIVNGATAGQSGRSENHGQSSGVHDRGLCQGAQGKILQSVIVNCSVLWFRLRPDTAWGYTPPLPHTGLPRADSSPGAHRNVACHLAGDRRLGHDRLLLDWAGRREPGHPAPTSWHAPSMRPDQRCAIPRDSVETSVVLGYWLLAISYRLLEVTDDE